MTPVFLKNINALSKKKNNSSQDLLDLYTKTKASAESTSTAQSHSSAELDSPVQSASSDKPAELLYETAKSGQKTARLLKDRYDLYVHSSFCPRREAVVFVNDIPFAYNQTIVLLGLGLGYQAREIMERMSLTNRLVLIEPDHRLFFKLLEENDYSDIFENDDVDIMVCENIEDMKAINQKLFNAYTLDHVLFNRSLPYYVAYKEYVDAVFEHINENTRDMNINRNTGVHMMPLYFKSVFKNTKYVFDALFTMDFKNAFKDKPAIIVSAGPSLDKNVHLLREAKGKAVIICMASAYISLRKRGIEPDFIASIDVNQIFLDKEYPNKTFSYPLLTSFYGSPQLLDLHKGIKILGNNSEDGFIPILAEVLGRQPSDFHMNMGGTVTTVALDYAARVFNCNPVILIGQDLANTDNKHHATDHVDVEKPVFNTCKVKDIYGGFVESNDVWIWFLRLIQEFIAADPSERLYIDATEGGAYIEGTKVMRLGEVIKKYCVEEIDVKGITDRIQTENQMSREERQKVLAIYTELKERLKEWDELVEQGSEMKFRHPIHSNEELQNDPDALLHLQNFVRVCIKFRDLGKEKVLTPFETLRSYVMKSVEDRLIHESFPHENDFYVRVNQDFFLALQSLDLYNTFVSAYEKIAEAAL